MSTTQFSNLRTPTLVLLACLMLPFAVHGAFLEFDEESDPSANGEASQADPGGQAQEQIDEGESEGAEEINTNDPTAPAISVAFGWEFYEWHEDEIAPGQTRHPGNDNNANFRAVIPLAKGTLGSPWPIINRFTAQNVKAQTGTSGTGNAELISLFVPKTWSTGKIAVGPAINFPADEEQYGTKAWRFGIAGVVLENSFNGKLMWGVLVRQVWGKTKANSDSVYASALALQPIAVYQLNGGWYISNGESPISYHWGEKEWMVPMGVRLGKTIGDRKGGIWNVYGEYRTNIVYKDWPGSAASDIIRIQASYTFGK